MVIVPVSYDQCTLCPFQCYLYQGNVKYPYVKWNDYQSRNSLPFKENPIMSRRATTRPYLIHMRLVHIFRAYCFKIHFSNIPHLILISIKRYIFFLLRVNETCTRVSLIYTPYLARRRFFDSPLHFGSIVLIFFLYFTNLLVISEDIRTYRHVDVMVYFSLIKLDKQPRNCSQRTLGMFFSPFKALNLQNAIYLEA